MAYTTNWIFVSYDVNMDARVCSCDGCHHIQTLPPPFSAQDGTFSIATEKDSIAQCPANDIAHYIQYNAVCFSDKIYVNLVTFEVG